MGTSAEADRLREVIRYDPATGVFTRIKRTGPRTKVGEEAGYLSVGGYRRIKWNAKPEMEHRLAWLYMIGEWPKDFIDHINLNRADNRWCNLRAATRSQNCANSPKRLKNTTRFKGITKRRYVRKDGKQYWQARARGRHRGTFDCPAAAHFAYIVAADNEWGDYSRSY